MALAAVLIFRSCREDSMETARITEESALIQSQIEQVAKLVVTEGHFSEVYTYEDSRELFGSLISARKKALVVVNAEASVSYDLSRLEYRLDPETKTLEVVRVPEPEVAINPEIKYYDVSADYLNPFGAEDYNAIQDRVSGSIREKVEASGLMENAQNRLLSELAEFYALTRSMGWTLVYHGRALDAQPGPELLRD